MKKHMFYTARRDRGMENQKNLSKLKSEKYFFRSTKLKSYIFKIHI